MLSSYTAGQASSGTQRVLGIFLIALMAIGCRNDGSQRDAYIRELRMHEDQIYELQDYMTEYQELLRRQRRENARLREQLASATPSPSKPADDGEEDERSLLDQPTEADPPDKEDSDLPNIEMGDPAMPEIEFSDPIPHEELEELPSGEPGDGETSFSLPGIEVQQVSAEISVTEPDSVEEDVFATPPMLLDRADSCAIYAEQTVIESNREGDQLGLMVIVEPLTTEGRAGTFTGELSLMLLDPIATESDQVVARWDFTPEEVEASWRDTSRRVLDLPIATPNAAPIGRPLELWVRLLPAEGDYKILTHTGIELVDPVRLIGVPVSGRESSTVVGGRISSGWMAADQLRSQARATLQRPAAWRPAVMLPPSAVARATAEPKAEGQAADSEHPQEWSPFR